MIVTLGAKLGITNFISSKLGATHSHINSLESVKGSEWARHSLAILQAVSDGRMKLSPSVSSFFSQVEKEWDEL